MSADTLRVIEEAIAAHVADEMGESRMVTGWVGYVSSMSRANLEEQTHGYMPITADGQPFHISIGLATMLNEDSIYQLNAVDDDDD